MALCALQGRLECIRIIQVLKSGEVIVVPMGAHYTWA